MADDVPNGKHTRQVCLARPHDHDVTILQWDGVLVGRRSGDDSRLPFVVGVLYIIWRRWFLPKEESLFALFMQGMPHLQCS